MAVLLAWMSWDAAMPDPALWDRLVARARARAPGVAEVAATSGLQAFALRTRTRAPMPLQRLPDGRVVLCDCERAEPLESLVATPRDSAAAVIVLDPSARRACLLRDRLGQRPLLWARLPGGVLIASGEDILRAHPAVSHDLDDDYLAAYFGASAPPAHASAWRAIRSAAPGEALTIDAAGERSTQLASEPLCEAFGWADARVHCELGERLQDAVDAASEDVDRLGLSLSSGLDSSAIASLLRPSAGTRPLAITYGCDAIAGLDERAEAAALAQACGLEHLALPADALGPLSTQQTPVCADTPIANPYRALKTRVYDEFRAAGVDVVLTGNFGDHLVAEPGHWLVDAVRGRRFDVIARSYGRMLMHGGPGALWRDRGWRSLVRGEALQQPVLPTWLLPQAQERLRALQRAGSGTHARWPHPRQAAHALGTYAAFDAAGECYFAQAKGIEVRHPYRHWPLVQMALSLPGHQSWRGGVRKFAVRAALAGTLGDRWRERPKHADMGDLFTRALIASPVRVRELVEIGRPWWSRHVDPFAVDRAVQTPAGGDFYSLLMWFVLGFGMWMEIID